MKFMHISDLHLGKRVNEFSMLEDQKDILRKILKIADEEKPQALLIAGDVYDKSIPTVEAIQLFDDFLCELSKRKVQTFIISGNHDSAERMAFGGRLMKEKSVIETYDVKTPGADKEIQFLSGGNQQKVIIGRAMACKPKLLVFDEPTKGIDVGTKTEIYRLMKKLAEEEGIGIIMISSEMEEIKKCSNRVIAMYEGKIAGEFDEYTEQQSILGAIIGVNS